MKMTNKILAAVKSGDLKSFRNEMFTHLEARKNVVIQKNIADVQKNYFNKKK